MRRYLSAVAVVVLFLATDTCTAGRPYIFFQPRSRHHHRIAPSYARVGSSYAEQHRYLNWYYPKYTGAFHANYFQQMGVAPGDVGFRGNGVYPTPW